MQEALWYGVIASLSFIGFLSMIFYILLSIYKTNDCGQYIISIPDDADEEKIRAILYGAYLRKAIYGDSVCNDVAVIGDNLSEERISLLTSIAEDCGGVRLCAKKEFLSVLYGKEKDGTKSS